MFSSFSCCFGWFILGALLGWLLNWLLCRLFGCCNKKSTAQNTVVTHTTNTAHNVASNVQSLAGDAVSATKSAASSVATKAESVTEAAVSGAKTLASDAVSTAESATNTVVSSAASILPTAGSAFVLDSTAAAAAGFKIKGPNDLTVIEGIGPKINLLFNNAGYTTFAEVSKMSEAQMQKILDDAGPRYRLAKPGTWAKQAELASQNKWAELKAWQDHLNHGV